MGLTMATKFLVWLKTYFLSALDPFQVVWLSVGQLRKK